jgi:hypothetical protein
LPNVSPNSSDFEASFSATVPVQDFGGIIHSVLIAAMDLLVAGLNLPYDDGLLGASL